MALFDASDKAFEAGQKIKFTHIPSNTTVEFKAWLTDFSDDYQSTWNSEEVYGRMDPVQTFHSTKRTINLVWDVVAASEEEAISNMTKAETLFQMLYPNYTSGNTLKSPPLLRLKFLNLVQDTKTKKGLVGTVTGFSFAPDIDQGFFDKDSGVVYPQTLKMQCAFTVLHTHNLGYGAHAGFPYNMHEEVAAPEEATPAPEEPVATTPAAAVATANATAQTQGTATAAAQVMLPIPPASSTTSPPPAPSAVPMPSHIGTMLGISKYIAKNTVTPTSTAAIVAGAASNATTTDSHYEPEGYNTRSARKTLKYFGRKNPDGSTETTIDRLLRERDEAKKD